MKLFLRMASPPLALLALLLAQPPAKAWAVLCPSNCGSCGCVHVDCGCGQELIYNYKLTGNIGPCDSSHGLIVKANNIAINGDGYKIFRTPPTNAADVYGVKISGHSNVTLRNLEVEGFRRGIHVGDAQGTKLVNIRSHGNTATTGSKPYGIDIASGAVETQILEDPSQVTALPISCAVYDNGDEGIHLGGGSSHTTIDGCDVYANAMENIYLENTFRNTVRNVQTWGGTLQLKIDGSHFNRFYENTFGATGATGAALLFAGDAHDNHFGFECHQPNAVNGRINIVANDAGKAPYSNIVRNTMVTANNNECVVFNIGDSGDQIPSVNRVENNPALMQCGTFAASSNRTNASTRPLYDPPGALGPEPNQICGNNQNNFPANTSNYIAGCTPRTCSCGTELTAFCEHQGALSVAEGGTEWWVYRGNGTNGGSAGHVLLSPAEYQFDWSDFRIVFLGLGLVAFQSVATCEYWTITGTPGTAILATASAIGPGETFTMIENGDGTYSFRASGGTYVHGAFGVLGYGGTSEEALRFVVHCDL